MTVRQSTTGRNHNSQRESVIVIPQRRAARHGPRASVNVVSLQCQFLRSTQNPIFNVNSPGSELSFRGWESPHTQT